MCSEESGRRSDQEDDCGVFETVIDRDFAHDVRNELKDEYTETRAAAAGQTQTKKTSKTAIHIKSKDNQKEHPKEHRIEASPTSIQAIIKPVKLLKHKHQKSVRIRVAKIKIEVIADLGQGV